MLIVSGFGMNIFVQIGILFDDNCHTQWDVIFFRYWRFVGC